MVGAELAEEKLGELMARLAPCFTRREPRLQAARYVRALMSGLPRKNGWTIAAEAGDRTPDKMQRLLSHASWDTLAAMREIGGFVTAYLDEAAGPGTLRVFAVDETGQQKKGTRTAGVKRQHMGCADGVANGINTVHVSYATPAGHALIGAREWIPEEQIADPRCRQAMGLPQDLVFKTKPQLATEILAECLAGGTAIPWAAADEVYGNNPGLRGFCERERIGYVLRVPSNFHLTLDGGIRLTAAQAVSGALGKTTGWWQTRSAGTGTKGQRLYRWAWIATASPGHTLLVRKHLITGELAFIYCHVPQGRPASLPVLVAVAGLRWPAGEDFEFGKDYFGLDQSQVRLYTAILRHTVLAMAALAVCAVTAALAQNQTDTQAPPPASPNDPPPQDPGLIPLTVNAVKRLFNLLTRLPRSLGHHLHWDQWTRRHQARSRWFHQRTRLRRQQTIPYIT